MTVVPDVPPVTIPVREPIEAIAGLLLLHVPPAVISLNIVVRVGHTVVVPVIAAGAAILTISVIV
jgi:hypothetical protein